VYNAITGYTLTHPEMLGGEEFVGVSEYAFFFVAMGLHFYINDTEFRFEHGEVYHRIGRFVLAGSVLLGALGGLQFSLDASVSVLFAFVAGGVLLNVFRRETPGHDVSDVRMLLFGGVGYAVLLQLA
jgi:hypothetical protein